MRIADVGPILVYKRTHHEDPDEKGRFGICDCMGPVRKWKFDAVIGVGGIGAEAKANNIDGKITWIGIGPHRDGWCKRGPILIFDHFRDLIGEGLEIEFSALARNLAGRMYSRNVRRVVESLTKKQREEAMAILEMAEDSPPSSRVRPRRNRSARRNGC